MFKFRSFRVAVTIFFFGLGLFPNHLPAQALAASSPTTTDTVSAAINAMTLDQKVGQLFMIGFPQTSLDENLKKLITTVKPGAFLLFKRNISSLEQVRKLNSDLKALTTSVSGLAPLIAVDQEGGVVSRVPVQPPLPSALALGLTNSPALAEMYGEEIGNLLKDLGFNMNLAPVLDLSDPQQPSFIGVRSFGGNPQKVGDLGYSISKGLLKSKIIPTAKHFPGLGSSLHDSHTTLVTRITNSDEFFKTDVRPFKKFSELGPESAVMLSHLSYPVLDPTNVPALFSEKIVRDLLRNTLGFKGIVITDDIMMQGASQYASPEDAAVLALRAGADIVMVTWSARAQGKAIRRVKVAIERKELSIADIDQKLRRILTAKILSQNSFSLPVRLIAGRPAPEKKLFELDQVVLESNIKLQNHKLDAFRAKDGLCVISSSSTFLNSFKKGTQLKLRYLFIEQAVASEGLESVIKRNRCESSLISIYGKKAANVVDGLSSEMKSKVLLVNLNTPLALSDEGAYLAVLNLYFPHFNAGQKIAQHLSRKDSSEGRGP